ncbi:hypothetical protein SBA1_1200004 [Candidatus Sulfotelmatobacter kueseliae]|uniref:Uncharacterized protein n=1 Tax=Candidatus Sulfotelmatobacter kueseliae TaxID=2042962 RepID=A0A2U3K3G4_9BACT|nr:hypothetical protein SBA1_1200004 [Candidatus Sulfotelmatobacter kueseliae]
MADGTQIDENYYRREIKVVDERLALGRPERGFRTGAALGIASCTAHCRDGCPAAEAYHWA